MTRRILSSVAVFILLLVVAVVGYLHFSTREGFRLNASLPNAIGLVVGDPVQLNGLDIGTITKLEARGDQAFMEMSLNGLREPLHSGTTVGVAWASVFGYRAIQLVPGPPQNPVLQSGAVIEAGSHQVTVEDLLEALDAPTRAHLQGMLKQLDTTLRQSQPDFNQTLKAAGPTVQALGAVLNGLGADGESIKTLLSNLHKVTDVLASRKASVSSSILDLNRFTSASAVYQRALSDGLKELPSTLDAAKTTLDKVAPATDATVPLLDDLRPATDRLPSVAHNLRPVMHDLRPAFHKLPRILKDADRVFERGPRFFDVANDTLGQLAQTVRPQYAGNAVRFLRPYIPEIVGWAGNWGNIFSGYDSVGHFVQIVVTSGESSLEGLPPIAVPGQYPEGHLPPGINGGQPWLDANSWDTDANGSRPR